MLIKGFPNLFKVSLAFIFCIISSVASAWTATIHSFSGTTAAVGSLVYSCWGTHACTIEIKRGANTVLNTTVNQGAFRSFSFNYGPGEYNIKITASRSIMGSHGSTYSQAGQSSRVHVLLNSGAQPLSKVVKYSYDAMGRLTTVSEYQGKTVTYEHDNAGNRIKKITH